MSKSPHDSKPRFFLLSACTLPSQLPIMQQTQSFYLRSSNKEDLVHSKHFSHNFTSYQHPERSLTSRFPVEILQKMSIILANCVLIREIDDAGSPGVRKRRFSENLGEEGKYYRLIGKMVFWLLGSFNLVEYEPCYEQPNIGLDMFQRGRRMQYALSPKGKRIISGSDERNLRPKSKSLPANRTQDPRNSTERDNYLDTNPPIHSFSTPTQQTHTNRTNCFSSNRWLNWKPK